MDATSSERERLVVRVAIVWLLILPLAAFWLTTLRPQGVAHLAVLPILPKGNEPVVATLRVSNPEGAVAPARFTLYADGRIVLEGATQVPGAAAKVVQFAQELPDRARGSYTATVATDRGTLNETHRFPEYSPQVLSSFVSFAASSTTMMSSLVNMSYYRSSFAGTHALDFGFVLVLVMLAMSIFIEAMSANPTRAGRMLWGLGVLAHRLRLVMASLYIVFGGLAVTRLAILFDLLP